MSGKLVSSMATMISLILLLLVVSVSGQGADVPLKAASYIPSDFPSNAPTNMPLTVPTILPTSTTGSAAPSDTPSDIPSDIPSYVPSNAPSDTPFGVPSGVPSDVPSSIPSPRLSQQPSLFPSGKPTFGPTTSTPTFTPTSSPSRQPFSLPSMAPSATPSTMPTIACHDDASYLSPINNLTCSSFGGTDCTAWRFLGLNVTELETLVDSCPLSCGIDCGSLERFEVKVTYRIIDALNFLDSASAGILEETSVEYLSKYVKDLEPASKFFLYEAELTAQQIQASNRAGDDSAKRSLRRTQAVEAQYTDLIVTVAFRGLAIILGNAAINALIVQGIDSAGYSRAIQRSGDPTFLDIEVTSSITDDSDPSKNSTKKDGGGGPSPGGTAAAVLMAFSFAGFGIGCFVKKRRTQTKAKAIAKTQEESDAQNFTSAAGSPRSTPVGSVSFEGNAGVVAGILRIMSSGSPRSNDYSTHSGQTSRQSSRASIPSSDGTTSSQSEEEHPYTGLIPPMIVIDNLDETSPRSAKKGGNRNVVPYQRLQASIELVAALNGTSGAYDPSVFQGELFSQSLVAKSVSRSSSDRSRSLSPGRFSRVWDSDAEDGSAGSIIASSYTKDELDAILDQQQPLDTNALAGAPVGANNGLRVTTTDLRPASRGSNRSLRDSPSRHQDSSPRSATSSHGNVSSPERERSFSDASTVLQGQYGEHSGEPPAPAEKLKEGGGFIQSFWHRSPSKAMPKIMSLTSLNGANSSDNNSFSHSRRESKGSSLNDDDESVTHIFWAPRKGKLGLVIECKSNGGPVVVHVKDYSPLLGQVLRGDKIAKIDNVSTLHMTLAEVTNLLGGGGKSSYLRGPVIQFVVLRCPNSSTSAGSFENQSIESMSQGGSFSDIFTSSDSLPTPK
jgi:hypothetical protein